MASTYTPIATQTVSGTPSSITFSSIPSTYTDLVLAVGGTASGDCAMVFQFNSDTGSNYSVTYLYGTGSSAVSGRNPSTSMTSMGRLNTTGGTSIVNFQNYSNTSTYKTVIGRGSAAASLVIATVGLWRSTSAISSMVITLESSNTFSAGTVLTLYGIASA